MQLFHNSKVVTNSKVVKIGTMRRPMLLAEREFQIFVVTPSGEKITLEVWARTTIRELWPKIQDKLDIQTDELILNFNGYPLYDNLLAQTLKLSDHKIRKESTLHLNDRAQKGFQILVITLSGETITINEVEASDTILYIMRKIQEKLGIHPDHQYMVDQQMFLKFEGMVFKENLKLSDYKIRKGSELHLTGRLRGGGQSAHPSEEVIPKFLGVPGVKDIWHIIAIHIYM